MKNSQKKHEDLKSMSLGDHLEELRARLILIILGLFAGMIISFFVGAKIVTFLEAPYYQAMLKLTSDIKEQEQQQDAGNEINTENLVHIRVSSQNAETLKDLKPGDSFLAHIEFYRDDPNNPAFAHIQEKIAREKAQKPQTLDPSVRGLQTIEVSEGFLIYLKVCLVFALILVSPWISWHLWAFVSAGLYRHERRYVKVVAPVSAALFITGAVFFMVIVAPLAMTFFIRFNEALQVQSNWTLKSYMNMILMLILVFGLAFQMPIVIFFAERLNLVTVKQLAASRKYVILGLFIVAAMATPPDVISQIALAIPLYALFEGSLVICRILRTKEGTQPART